MKPVLRATWASRVGEYRQRKGKETGTAVRDRLIRIRDRWAADVRVDTRHYRDTIEATEPVMEGGGTRGYLQPPFEVYFAANEYGGPTITARPSMRQAVEAERADFMNVLDAIFRGSL
jgi:hypothetical protein